MPGRAIPYDWDEQNDGYALFVTLVPNSILWRGTVKGLFLDLIDLWRWDEDTGNRQEAVDVAIQIFEDIEMTKIDDLIAELTGIKMAIENLDLGREDCQGEFSDDFTNDVDGWSLQNAIGNWELLHGTNNALRLKYTADVNTTVSCEAHADVDVLLGNGSVLFAYWFSGSTNMDEVKISLLRADNTVITEFSQLGPLDEGTFVKSLSSEYEQCKKIVIYTRKDIQTGTINFYVDAIALMCG